MGIIELLLIAVGLSMDAFAVSVCKGLSVPRLKLSHGLLAGFWFGGFQFLMPVIGFVLGSRFEQVIKSFDHWIAFVLLGVIGLNMIREAFSQDEKHDDDFSCKTMLLMAVATSIDALAVGITFACLGVRILPAAGMIGVTTFLLCILGINVGHVFGAKYHSRAQIAGGLILILIGSKILLEHLGIIAF